MSGPVDPLEAESLIREDLAAAASAVGASGERLAGKTLLLTGGTGFLGSYLARLVAHLNDSLSPADRTRLLLVVRDQRTNAGVLDALAGRPDVRFLRHDLRERWSLPGAVDYVVHAASPAAPSEYLSDPVGTADMNSLALRSLLRLAMEKDVGGFLFFSSSEVYGDPQAVPTPESDPGRVAFSSARACYAESKRFGEMLCMAFHHEFGVPVNVVRPFHLYGPGMRKNDSRLIPAMMLRAVTGMPLELAGDGRSTRAYGYVADATAGFLNALLFEGGGEAFNIGADGPEVSAADAATRIAELFGCADVVTSSDPGSPALLGSPRRAMPDLSKARELLGYSCPTRLDDGLRRTASWYLATYGREC